jgi:hypothetical protein
MEVKEAYALHFEENQMFQLSDGRIDNQTAMCIEWWKQFEFVHLCNCIRQNIKFKPYLKKKGMSEINTYANAGVQS